MPTTTLVVPEGYNYVIFSVAASLLGGPFHSFMTSAARKKAGIKYPITYASEEQAAKDPAAFKFNCAQRAHANFSENHLPVVGAALIAGLRFPYLSAGLAGAWCVGRVFYSLGYVSGGPSARHRGMWVGPCTYLLILLSVYTAAVKALQ